MTQSHAPTIDNDLLTDYLQDHLVAANSGAQVFAESSKLWADTPYGERVEALAADIEQDRQELIVLARRLGMELSAPKKVISNIGRTLSRLNPLNPSGSPSGLFGQLELEGLHTAVAGKECLWHTLQELSAQDDRIKGNDMKRLLDRAQDQQSRIGELIRETAAVRFRVDKSL